MRHPDINGIVHMAGNGLFKGYLPSNQQHTPQVPHQDKNKNTLKILEQLLSLPAENVFPERITKSPTIVNTLLDGVTDILAPDEIQHFLFTLQAYEDEQNYAKVGGLVTSCLIRNSYNHGFSEFRLDLRGIKPLHYLCHEVQNNKDWPFTVIVHGNGGDCFGWNAKGRFFVEETIDLAFLSAESTVYMDKTDYNGLNSFRGTAYIENAGHSLCNPYFEILPEVGKIYVKHVGVACGLDDINKEIYIDRTAGTIRDPTINYGPLSSALYHSRSTAVLESLNCPPLRRRFLDQDEWRAAWQPAQDAFALLHHVLGGGSP